MNFVEANDIVKQYANHLALNKVSIHVPKGEIFGLLGPNGAGKSTLIRIINRITAPDSGSVFIDGRPSVQDDVYKIGYLPEERGLYKKMKVGEQAIYMAQLKGLDYFTAKKRLQIWFEKFDIMPWWNKKLEELSKGMQQKIQFIITVIHDPELLIFDEPFSGFDPVNAELLKQEILEFKKKGKTIIFSTHNMSSVEEICDEIALIDKANVVLSGKVSDIKQRYKSDILNLSIQGNSFNPASPLFDVLTESQQGNILNLQLHKKPTISNTAIISSLIESYEIIRFEELLPSMNEIFIETVSKQKSNT